MKIYLKSQINSLSIVVIAAKVYFIFRGIGLIVGAITGIFLYNNDIINFIKLEYFKSGISNPAPWVGILFMISLASLHIFLITKLRKGYELLERYKKGELLHSNNTSTLYNIGKGLNFYGYVYYILMAIFGVFIFTDFSVLWNVFPYALLFILLGKLVLLLSKISDKGTSLKKENDLTI